MEVQIASLCDSAADYGGGKLSFLGAFDTILVREFPAVHSHCSVALRIIFRDTDEGEHDLQLAMIDEDGRNQLPDLPPARINVKLGEQMFFSSNNFVFNLQGLQFPAAGQYSIDITMDQKIIARIPLQVLQVQAGQMPGQQPPNK
ncbi:MAG: hypothetical protein CMO80_10190 [Verrucomicrobiales bacterium]|nr:hypothetical protein [Verrucomicrobiales bacterium]